MTPSPYATNFGRFDGRIWLNAAHQGPLPLAAASALEAAIADRLAPYRIADADFSGIPARLHELLARLVGGASDEIALGNSASYGLDVLAQGIAWRPGDEVLVVDGDFPASVFPWRVLEPRGVTIRFLRADENTAVAVAEHLTDRTRVFCTSWVNSFTGYAIDIDAIGRVCRDAGVWFVLNAAQGMGTRGLDVTRVPVDAVTSCGYKFLCGPYGTGFVWIAPALRDTLEPLHTYWLPNVWNQPGGLQQYDVKLRGTAQVHDIGCPANFFNYVPWVASLEYILSIGVAEIARYNQALIDDFLPLIDDTVFELVSPRSSACRSTLVVLRPRAGDSAPHHARLAAAGVDVAQRGGAIRLAPHLYNSAADLARAAAVLRQ
ncbi:MAG TPA: aminotransferase class V-fold PLP-dependent enzyme [Gemmatimonadaceae bacterium]|nr:aminotransferase class V-fold PLP-dependent enzyme [Gemmatimonadaceae bacterium]